MLLGSVMAPVEAKHPVFLVLSRPSSTQAGFNTPCNWCRPLSTRGTYTASTAAELAITVMCRLHAWLVSPALPGLRILYLTVVSACQNLSSLFTTPRANPPSPPPSSIHPLQALNAMKMREVLFEAPGLAADRLVIPQPLLELTTRWVTDPVAAALQQPCMHAAPHSLMVFSLSQHNHSQHIIPAT